MAARHLVEIEMGADEGQDRWAKLHEELGRLPDSFREPLVLCYLEGFTQEQAAAQLRCPLGTVQSRLARGRAKLKARLTKRGFDRSDAFPGAVLWTQQLASAPGGWAEATVRLAMQFTQANGSVTGRTVTAAALAEEVLRAMVLTKLTVALGTMLFAAVLISGAATWAQQQGKTAALIVETRVAVPKENAKPERLQEQAPVLAVRSILGGVATARAGVSSEEVQRAIDQGVRFLKGQQNGDGSWIDLDEKTKTGMTSLATLALLAAAEKPGSPAIDKALGFLRGFGPDQLNSTYAIALQTMVFAAANPSADQLRIAANVNWLEQAQIQMNSRVPWPGSWSYSDTKRPQVGDNSNTQYALLGLHAATEVGVPVNPQVWTLARSYWEMGQKFDGSFAYTPEKGISTASMTCAGISSLIITNRHSPVGKESLKGEEVENCGKSVSGKQPNQGLNWMASHFQINQNSGAGPLWVFYYLVGLERAGRLSGSRFIGEHDWYRLAAQSLVRQQNKTFGYWEGVAIERNHVLATSLAVTFLAKGRAPVLIKKLSHGPSNDWNNDPDDIPNLVGIISRDRNQLLTWQVADPDVATIQELLETPILFFNGHKAPDFTAKAKQNLRDFVGNGGLIFAEACCANAEFDRGFRRLMKELFPDEESALHPLAADHPVWRAWNLLDPEIHPLWGIEQKNRTVVIYSPRDLSCYWNQAEHSASSVAVIKAIRIGQNIIEYATGRKILADKLVEPRIAGIRL
jgi:Domain of unknown function (DUF4159)/Sigma-70, region 4